MNSRIVLICSLSSLFLAACSPQSAGDSAVSAAGACVGMQKSIPLSSISLQAGSEASKSEAVRASLSEDPSCVGVSNVSWNVPSGKIISQDSAGVVASFSQPGHYVIQAKLDATGSSALVSQSTTVVDNAPILSGPQVGMIGMDLNYSVVIPAGLQASSVAWNFGDGSMASGVSVTHAFQLDSEFVVKANVVLSNGNAYELSQNVQVLLYYDNFECLPEARISAPQSAEVGDSVNFVLNVPNCLNSAITDVKWTFGDSGSASGRSVNHVYNAIGLYEVVAVVESPLSYEGPLFTLRQQIRILEKTVEVPEEPEEPAPKCSTLGEQKFEYSNEVSTAEACGLNGTKDVIRHTKEVYECRYEDLVQDWVLVSSSTEVKSESACSGQSCRLPDGSVLANGASQVLYSSSTPAGSCESVSQSRSCSNGTLSGSSSYSSVTCNAGCPGFGIHGSSQVGIEIGDEQVPRACTFGEAGIFDIYKTIEDRSCSNGSVVKSNQRRGDLVSAGSCPTYSYQSTGAYTECSAACGGSQNLIYKCVDNKGSDAPADRCGGSAPVVSRVCDGNPDAVARQEVSVSTEDAGSSGSCPKNQIGIVLLSREVKTVKSYACIDHSVKLASEVSTPGPWIEERYCRDYVAYRCSHDSLSNTEAHARYDWMQKCRSKVPVIDEFLKNFEDVTTSKSKNGIDGSSAVLYPTFMNAGVSPEKPWIAPKKATASCDVPARVYISAVCVSSCATPEQMIQTEAKSGKQMTFIEALTSKAGKVVTLSTTKSTSPKDLVETAVDSWVTELVDTDHQIVQFNMASGGTLRVTRNHPLLDSSGEMKLAQDFAVGDSLLKLGGIKDRIVSIQSQVHSGKVYNLFTASSEPARNIVVVGGYLNGTAFFQNAGADFVNTQVLRKNLIKGVFGKGGK